MFGGKNPSRSARPDELEHQINTILTDGVKQEDYVLTLKEIYTLGFQPYPQKVVRPPKPTPTTFSGGGWSPRDIYIYISIYKDRRPWITR